MSTNIDKIEIGKKKAKDYLEQHNIMNELKELLLKTVEDQPSDPIPFMVIFLI